MSVESMENDPSLSIAALEGILLSKDKFRVIDHIVKNMFGVTNSRRERDRLTAANQKGRKKYILSTVSTDDCFPDFLKSVYPELAEGQQSDLHLLLLAVLESLSRQGSESSPSVKRQLKVLHELTGKSNKRGVDTSTLRLQTLETLVVLTHCICSSPQALHEKRPLAISQFACYFADVICCRNVSRVHYSTLWENIGDVLKDADLEGTALVPMAQTKTGSSEEKARVTKKVLSFLLRGVRIPYCIPKTLKHVDHFRMYYDFVEQVEASEIGKSKHKGIEAFYRWMACSYSPDLAETLNVAETSSLNALVHYHMTQEGIQSFYDNRDNSADWNHKASEALATGIFERTIQNTNDPFAGHSTAPSAGATIARKFMEEIASVMQQRNDAIALEDQRSIARIHAIIERSKASDVEKPEWKVRSHLENFAVVLGIRLDEIASSDPSLEKLRPVPSLPSRDALQSMVTPFIGSNQHDESLSGPGYDSQSMITPPIGACQPEQSSAEPDYRSQSLFTPTSSSVHHGHSSQTGRPDTIPREESSEFNSTYSPKNLFRDSSVGLQETPDLLTSIPRRSMEEIGKITMSFFDLTALLRNPIFQVLADTMEEDNLEEMVPGANEALKAARELGEPVTLEEKASAGMLFDSKDILFHKKLGAGGFGEVYATSHKYIPKLFMATKVTAVEKTDAIQLFVRSIATQAAVPPQYIPVSFSFCILNVDYEKIKGNPLDTEIPETLLILENMQLGGKNLSKITEEYPEELRLKKRSSEKTKQELEKIDKHNLLVGYKRILDAEAVFVTLFEALPYLHDNKGMHRNLKPENIIQGKEEPGECQVNWICDFGIARYLQKVLPRDRTRQNTICYTPGFVAPEARHGYATPDSDIYSIGMIFYTLFCGSDPDPNSPRINDCPLKWFNEDAFQGSNKNDPTRQFILYLTRPLGIKECWPSHPELCIERRPDARKALEEFGRLIVNLRELVNRMEPTITHHDGGGDVALPRKPSASKKTCPGNSEKERIDGESSQLGRQNLDASTKSRPDTTAAAATPRNEKERVASASKKSCPAKMACASNSEKEGLAKMIKNYQILIPQSTWQTSLKYFDDLRAREAGNQATCTPADGRALPAGKHFQSRLESSGILSDSTLAGSAFYHAMMHQFINTKKPQIFAESAVFGRAEKDWSPNELLILGDIAIAVPVTIYDNGNHEADGKDAHETPFQGTLLYVPGALLNNGQDQIPCDLPLVANRNGNDWIIDQDKVNALYERRLLPSLMYANTVCKNSSTTALVTMPGLGCGMFAGAFKGKMGEHLRKAVEYILTKHGEKLDSVKAVYYDPYLECENSTKRFGGIPFMVRPLCKAGERKIARQLDSPKVFNEIFDDAFDSCHLFSIVAWDHVSWPGNDYWDGARATDDGVKAAATSSMGVMTGYEGEYNQLDYVYEPPKDLEDVDVWKDVVSKFRLEIDVSEGVNFHIDGLV